MSTCSRSFAASRSFLLSPPPPSYVRSGAQLGDPWMSGWLAEFRSSFPLSLPYFFSVPRGSNFTPSPNRKDGGGGGPNKGRKKQGRRKKERLWLFLSGVWLGRVGMLLVSEKVIRNGAFQIHYSLHMPDGFIGSREHEGWMIDGPTHTPLTFFA